MTDHGMVPNGLECCMHTDGKTCRKCPYALELLKAQEQAKPIDYQDCANAMLKMWMENVLTDGEYSKIMDKLNNAYKQGKL